MIIWRRRADSNRCIEVLQTSPLTTWVRRPSSLANMILSRDARTAEIIDNPKPNKYLILNGSFFHGDNDHERVYQLRSLRA
jgi:hypothetical protein